MFGKIPFLHLNCANQYTVVVTDFQFLNQQSTKNTKNTSTRIIPNNMLFNSLLGIILGPLFLTMGK